MLIFTITLALAMPPRSSPLTTFHSLDQDVFDVMTSHVNLRDVANIAKTSKKNRDAVRETRLDRSQGTQTLEL